MCKDDPLTKLNLGLSWFIESLGIFSLDLVHRGIITL